MAVADALVYTFQTCPCQLRPKVLSPMVLAQSFLMTTMTITSCKSRPYIYINMYICVYICIYLSLSPSLCAYTCSYRPRYIYIEREERESERASERASERRRRGAGTGSGLTASTSRFQLYPKAQNRPKSLDNFVVGPKTLKYESL